MAKVMWFYRWLDSNWGPFETADLAAADIVRREVFEATIEPLRDASTFGPRSA